MLVGVGALVAASRSGNGSIGQAAWRPCRGPSHDPEQSACLCPYPGGLCRFVRGSGSLKLPANPPRACMDSFKRLADQMLHNSRLVDPYMQTHPLPAERVRALQGLASASPHWDKRDSASLQARHEMVRAKLFGFMDPPDSVVRRYPAQQQQPPGTLRACDRGLSLRQFCLCGRHQPDRHPHPSPTAEPLLHELKARLCLKPANRRSLAPLRRAVQLTRTRR